MKRAASSSPFPFALRRNDARRSWQLAIGPGPRLTSYLSLSEVRSRSTAAARRPRALSRSAGWIARRSGARHLPDPRRPAGLRPAGRRLRPDGPAAPGIPHALAASGRLHSHDGRADFSAKHAVRRPGSDPAQNPRLVLFPAIRRHMPAHVCVKVLERRQLVGFQVEGHRVPGNDLAGPCRYPARSSATATRHHRERPEAATPSTASTNRAITHFHHIAHVIRGASPEFTEY
jgi:hypothetical protein